MYSPSLKQKYKTDVVPTLKERFGWTNVMEVPKLQKICLNQGVGRGVADKKLVDTAVQEMSIIAGQQAVPTISRKAISNFKLREDMAIGCKVTLRGDNMYEFLERLVAISLPRVRDFQGVSDKGFDGRGNYTMGVTEQIIFPEIDIDKVNTINGMDITFVTTANNDVECLELLKELGVPFKNQIK
ncbi:MAG: large subunit ribosomal protein L5 [Bacteroidia bacterium]|jgi:large subunit ribosomal protein L5